jgi:hypothetical protein
MTQITPISYDHGVSDRKLLGETIGAFFDRAVETWRDREALVVRQQDVRWSWGPRLISLGAYVDAIMAGADEADALGRPTRSGWRSSRRPGRGSHRAIRSLLTPSVDFVGLTSSRVSVCGSGSGRSL